MSPEYIAGFFDGEGCISQNSDGRWSIHVYQKDPVVLKEIQEFLGFGSFCGPNIRGMHCLSFGSQVNMQAFVKVVLPHVRVKRKVVLRLNKELQRKRQDRPWLFRAEPSMGRR